MSAAVRATGPSDLVTLSSFLAHAYNFATSDPHADTRFLEWKYLVPRSGWTGSRSYVLEKDGRIAAHCGIAPTTFCLADGRAVSSLTLMDWAADPAIPGAGITLFRKLTAMAPTAFIIGGAPVTRQIVPRIGFQHVADAPTYSAWLHPWREFQVRPRTPRSVARLFHGWTHPARSQGPNADPWDCTPVAQFDDSLQNILNRATRSWSVCRRTLADLNYVLQCPLLRMEGFLLRKAGTMAGYFVVGKSDWEARLLDMALTSEDSKDWRDACHAIVSAIRQDPRVARIRVQSTIPVMTEALTSNGFWFHGKEPIFICDPAHALEQAFPVAFQLFDSDSGY